MTNKTRIIIIIVLIILMVVTFFVLVRPAMQRNMNIYSEIEQQKETNSQLRSTVAQLVNSKEDFNILYARYQRYSVELPGQNNIQVLANELYSIAQFSEVELDSVNFNETTSRDGDIGIIDISLILIGPYYNILVFVNTVESMPRITELESINLSYSADGYPEMAAAIIGKTFYQITE